MTLKLTLALMLSMLVLTAEAQTQDPSRKRARPVARPTAPPRDIVPDFSETPDQESLNTLGDIVYLAPYHSLVASLTYGNSNSKTDINLSGNNYAKLTNASNTVGYSVDFGLFKDVEISAGGNYLASQTSDTTYGIASPTSGSTAHSTSAGFSEPSFTGTYRILDQDKGSVNLHASLGYSPAMDNSKSGSAQTQGNNMRGGDEISAGIVISKKLNPFELAGGFSFTQDGSTTSESAQSTTKSKGDAYSTMSYKLGARLELGSVFLLGTVQYFTISSHGSISSTGSVSNAPAYSYTSINVGGDYEIKKNFLLIRLLYQMAPQFTSTTIIASQKYDVQVSMTGFAGQLLVQF